MLKIIVLLAMFIMSIGLMAVKSENVVLREQLEQCQKQTVKDVNFLLHKDGYRIYFKLDTGQLALVHPAKSCNESCEAVK